MKSMHCYHEYAITAVTHRIKNIRCHTSATLQCGLVVLVRRVRVVDRLMPRKVGNWFRVWI